MTSGFRDLAALREAFARLHDRVARVFVGPRAAIESASIALLAGGHLLIEDVPGVGKTTLAQAYARSLGASFRRIQFTPDLLPQDILGQALPDLTGRELRFMPGPIFTEVLLADEINRTPPRTQSALLEAMSERQVTIDGVTRPLPAAFLVLATMNPLEHHGTYELPESQLDRFTLRVGLGWPDRDALVRLLAGEAGQERLPELEPAFDAEAVPSARLLVQNGVHAARELIDYVLDLGQAARQHAAVRLGPSPRALLALLRCARARAALMGRDHVVPDDVKALWLPVLAHRIAIEGGGSDAATALLTEVLERCPVPGSSLS